METIGQTFVLSEHSQADKWGRKNQCENEEKEVGGEKWTKGVEPGAARPFFFLRIGRSKKLALNSFLGVCLD